MPKEKYSLDRFQELTWQDMEQWAGSKILSRGKSYQRNGRVSDLRITRDGGLIAWVAGSQRYATKVVIDTDGLPESVCTCPYRVDCKHGVAVVIEYLKRVEKGDSIPEARSDDQRLQQFEEENLEEELTSHENFGSTNFQKDIGEFLSGKTKAELVDLIQEIAREHPGVAQDLIDRHQLTSGKIKTLVERLRREIRDIGEEPGWQDYWKGDGFTPDYSGIRKKLETLLKEGYADEVLALGEELLTNGIRQVEESHDHGETAMEIAYCMPVIVKALAISSLDPADKLNRAVDAVLKDQFDICDLFAEYLHRRHPKSAWSELADRLMQRLNSLKAVKGDNDYSRIFARDQLTNWIIHALEQAGRKEEIIPLCEAEAEITHSYDRLVARLIQTGQYEHAERWIHKGIRATRKKLPGIAQNLRHRLLEIRTREKNWPAVAAILVEEFVRYPSRRAYTDCRKACNRIKLWPGVRRALLAYLETGKFPWKQKDWPLPRTGLEEPESERKSLFPMLDLLIGIAIVEKRPDQVLHWYDQLPKNQLRWRSIDCSEIADAIQYHAPDRAVEIWKKKAEELIALVKPKAYQEAARYLRRARAVEIREKREQEWSKYLQGLKEAHWRKRRLMEILDGLEGKPIVRSSGTHPRF